MRSIPRILGEKTSHFYQVFERNAPSTENSFPFNGKDYLQTHGTATRKKMAVAFANIFMAKVEKEIHKATQHQSFGKDSPMTLYPCETKASRDKIEDFLLQANSES